MKKIGLFSSLGMLLVLASCDTKDGYSSTNYQIHAPAISIITDLNDQSVVVKEGSYLFDLELSTKDGQHGTVTSPDLISNNSSLVFTTEKQEYLSTGYDAFFKDAQGVVNENTSLKLNDANFEALYLYDDVMNQYNGYYYTLADVGNLTYAINTSLPYITVAKYNLGSDYRVNTFQKNSFFVGTTNTVYPFQGQTQTYTTEDIIYRFILSTEEGSKDYTATMIMYNAKFSAVPQEPTKTVVVRGLDVAFTADGVSITGENIVPEMYSSGEGFVPMQNYIFNSFEFHTTDAYYIYGTMNYKIAGIYTGQFAGSYIKSYYL